MSLELLKQCSACLDKKLSHEFYIRADNQRLTSQCKECSQKRYLKYYYTHQESSIQKTLKWAKNHKDQHNQTSYRWILNNPQRRKEIKQKYNASHRELNLVHARKAQLQRLHRIPKFGQNGIKEFYLNKPKGLEVDHIIPLQGKLVSGLHVIWNLQYLSPEQNRKKGNKFNG